jgi:hypothetical protein
MTLCGLCNMEPRGPWYVHRAPTQHTNICESCFDEFRQFVLDPVRSAARTDAIVRGDR